MRASQEARASRKLAFSTRLVALLCAVLAACDAGNAVGSMQTLSLSSSAALRVSVDTGQQGFCGLCSCRLQGELWDADVPSAGSPRAPLRQQALQVCVKTGCAGISGTHGVMPHTLHCDRCHAG